MATRRSGSVRFDDYHKLQEWDPTSLAWRDIQHTHPTPDAATASARTAGRYRIMTITTKGRTPGAPFDIT